MSPYRVKVTPDAWKEIKDLPGNMRQRVRNAIDGLASDPRPAQSKALDVPDLPIGNGLLMTMVTCRHS